MSLREEIEQIIYDDDGKMPAKGTVDAIVTLIENEKAKQREETVEKMISEAWKCRTELVQEEIVYVTHGDLVSIGNDLKKVSEEKPKA